jgi:serine/threonine protein kinase
VAARVVGDYELIEPVGRGAVGIVYRARQLDLDRLVAVKELAQLGAGDPEIAKRFLREALVAADFNHPNIVTVYDYVEEAGGAYIAMEYLPRGSLRPHVGALALEQVAGVMEDTLAGLAEAERLGIVHRDLKPENLLVTDEGGVTIADFGIAKALNDAAAGLTAAGFAVGTPAYMAPEQAMDAAIGPATDLYSVGVIGYELLVGRVPFAGDGNPLSVLLKHVTEPVPPPRELNPNVDPQLARWLGRMLAKDAAARPQRAEDAWTMLEEAVIALAGPRWRRKAAIGPTQAT